MDREPFEYVIDANDVITEVNEAWRAFARENDSEGLGERAVGSWLWQHIAGVEVKHLFRVLIERVREGGKVVRFPFRCDAPELRRHMMMEVTPLAANAIRFASWVVEEETRAKVHLLESDRAWAPDSLLRMCAWCKRVDAGRPDVEVMAAEVEKWREVEDALAELKLFHLERLPRITHGVCSECRDRVLKELDEAV